MEFLRVDLQFKLRECVENSDFNLEHTASTWFLVIFRAHGFIEFPKVCCCVTNYGTLLTSHRCYIDRGGTLRCDLVIVYSSLYISGWQLLTRHLNNSQVWNLMTRKFLFKVRKISSILLFWGFWYIFSLKTYRFKHCFFEYRSLDSFQRWSKIVKKTHLNYKKTLSLSYFYTFQPILP